MNTETGAAKQIGGVTKIVVAATICWAYQKGKLPFRYASTHLQALGVPKDAIPVGLGEQIESCDGFDLPPVFRPYLNQ